MSANDFVSIIIPLYNCEDRIIRCVNSVLQQTYKNIEVIVIDDGSTDNSLAVLKNGISDPRLQIYTQDNHGVSYTRNRGMKIALESNPNGWITFVDSDDYIAPNTIEDILNNTNSNDVDYIHYGYRLTDYNDNEVRNFCSNDEFVIGQCDAYRNTMDGRINERRTKGAWLILVTSGLFKKDILKRESLYFDENINLGEDYLFVVQYLSYCKKVKIVAKPFYTWWQRQGSLSSVSKFRTARQIKICNILWPIMFDKIKGFDHELDDTFVSWVISHFNFLSKLSVLEKLDYAEVKEWFNVFISNEWLINFIASQNISNFNDKISRMIIKTRSPKIIYLFIKALGVAIKFEK